MRRKSYIILILLCLWAGMTFISCSGRKEVSKEIVLENEAADKKSISNNEADSEELSKSENDPDELNNEFNTEGGGYSSSIRDIPSVELVKEFSIGWNLGNTLDSTGGGALPSTEMSWGNPYTKKKVFDKVKEAGFNIVRIPVSWGNHLGPAPDYRIHDVWLDRVNEVVDYAIDNGLYVILNMHHEEWHFPSYDNFEEANAILTSVWAQIAERFKDYDEHLIFEGMNEPRMKGTPYEWNGGNAEARDVINKLNQSFVDTIRGAGGNNPYRHLMVPTYAASSDIRTWEDFVIPEDDKVIVSIHAYTPYDFALNKEGTSEWSRDNPKDTADIDYLFDNLYDWFISRGYPVIIGEFGAMDKDNLQDRAEWAKYYVQKASEKGIPCIWWDNGAFTGDGELFGLLDRREYTWKHPEIIEALMEVFLSDKSRNYNMYIN